MQAHSASLDRLLQSEKPPSRVEVDIHIRLPADLRMINWAVTLDRLTESLGGGDWCYRMPAGKPGRYEVEVQP